VDLREHLHKSSTSSLGAVLRSFFNNNDALAQILKGTNPTEKALVPVFMNRISYEFKNINSDKKFRKRPIDYALESILLLKLCKSLEDEKMQTDKSATPADDIDSLLDKPEKRAAYYVGVLAGRLIAIQQQNRGSKPFMRKLYGLRINNKKLNEIFTQVIAKFDEYDARFYRDIEEKAGHNLTESDKTWALTPDETSYYFTLGYTLNKLYAKQSKKTKEDEKNG
jgi:CRISPR-associated protein Csh1